jgi:hypothetical protein
MRPVVLSLCDRTGTMVKPWAAAGCDCFCVDLQHPPGMSLPGDETVFHIGADIHQWDGWGHLPGKPVIVFAFPPCTDLAGSGARWWSGKGLTACIDALKLVDRCRELAEKFQCPWMLENPVGRLATCWRKPDHTFDPCDYGGYLTPPGDAYTKRTCLWTGSGFVMPDKRPVAPEGVRPGQPNAWYSKVGGKSEKTKNYRSQTPDGFARAVFEANRHIINRE